MNDGSIRIIIGAAMDRSVETVFSSIEKRAQKAGQTIGKSFSSGISGGGGSGGATKGFDAAAAASHKAEKEIERDIANRVKAAKAAAREMTRDHEKSARDWVKADMQASREIINQFKDITRQRKRELERQEADAKKASQPSRFAKNFGMYATRNLLPGSMNAMGMASRVGGDLLRGAGVDISVAGSISRAVQMQSGSVQLANQERIATGSTIGSKQWNSISRDVGSKLSVDSNSVQDMILAMTAKTGEFKGAAGMAGDLAGLGVASGANLRDMGNAAGYVFNQMNKLQDGGKRTIEVMRGIVGQTAVGAVDMPDYAVQLGRIAANASKFQGDVGDNIREQSALAQLAVEAGGASSPADAARSVAAFSNTFGKHARIAAFAAHNVELFTTSNEEARKTGKPQDTLRKASDIIKDSFRQTKGDIPALSIMFADTLGRKPVQALATAYKAAGGGDAGIDAIQKQLDKYMNASLTKEAEAQNIKDYQESTAAKAIKFQNELDKIASIAADSVFPALEKLAPMALSAADGLGKFASFAANNPIGGALSLVAASIANAGLQAGVRSTFEMLITKTGGAGLAVGALGVAALAAAAYMEADIAAKDEQDKHDAVAQGNAGASEANIRVRAQKTGVLSEADQDTLKKINANLEFRVGQVGKLKRGEMGEWSPNDGDAEMAWERAFDPDKLAARNDASHDKNLIEELESNRMLLDAIRTGVLAVKVTNPQEIGSMSAVGPKVYAPGRQLDAGNLPAYLHR